MRNEDVFDHLYDEYFRKVYSYFTVCFNEDIAADLSQQVFMKVWSNLSRLGSYYPENWLAWIFRVAVNTKNDFLRRKYSSPDIVDLDENYSPVFSNEEGLIDSFSVKKALDLLSVEERDILLLKANGLNSSELGNIFKISASAARSRIAAAKNNFKKNLERMGVGGFERN